MSVDLRLWSLEPRSSSNKTDCTFAAGTAEFFDKRGQDVKNQIRKKTNVRFSILPAPSLSLDTKINGILISDAIIKEIEKEWLTQGVINTRHLKLVLMFSTVFSLVCPIHFKSPFKQRVNRRKTILLKVAKS